MAKSALNLVKLKTQIPTVIDNRNIYSGGLNTEHPKSERFEVQIWNGRNVLI